LSEDARAGFNTLTMRQYSYSNTLMLFDITTSVRKIYSVFTPLPNALLNLTHADRI